MEPDPRIQEGLVEWAGAADSISGPLDAAEVRARAVGRVAPPAHSRRWAFALSGLSALLVAVTVVVVDGGSDHREIATSPRPPDLAVAPRPESIIAVQDNALVELDALSGGQKRVIASGFAPYGVDSLSLVESSAAVVGGMENPMPCPGGEGSTVGVWGTVDLTSGAVQPAAFGTDVRRAFSAVVSPDGGRVAYLEDHCGLASVLVVSDPAGGVLGTFAPPVRAGAELYIAGVAGWDGDGHHLVVELSDALLANPKSEWLYVDMTDYVSEAARGEQHVLHGAKVPTDPALLQLAPLGTPGRWAAVIGGAEAGSMARLVEYDLTSGAVVRDLVGWDDANAIVHIAAADRSGRHLLVVVYPDVQTRSDGNLLINGSPVLYRWAEGDQQLAKVADGVNAAAWLPTEAWVDPSDLQGVVDHEGNFVGYISRAELRALGHDVEHNDDLMIEVRDENGKLTGYFAQRIGFIDRETAEAPGFDLDVARQEWQDWIIENNPAGTPAGTPDPRVSTTQG